VVVCTTPLSISFLHCFRNVKIYVKGEGRRKKAEGKRQKAKGRRQRAKGKTATRQFDLLPTQPAGRRGEIQPRYNTQPVNFSARPLPAFCQLAGKGKNNPAITFIPLNFLPFSPSVFAFPLSSINLFFLVNPSLVNPSTRQLVTSINSINLINSVNFILPRQLVN
jgi:hypothetical protein